MPWNEDGRMRMGMGMGIELLASCLPAGIFLKVN